MMREKKKKTDDGWWVILVFFFISFYIFQRKLIYVAFIIRKQYKTKVTMGNFLKKVSVLICISNRVTQH